MVEINLEIKNFFDENGKLKIWPGKRKKQLLILEHLAGLFLWGKEYSEKEINEILENNHSFGDPLLLRRELFDSGYLNRKKDGSTYWREGKKELNG